MARQRFTNGGYTLIEMLLVLTLLSVFLLLVPFHHAQRKTLLYTEMEALRQHVLQAQSEAILTHRRITVQSDTAIYIQNKRILRHSKLSCARQSFHFNAQGNVSKACTLHCQMDGKQASLVIELGSGRMYVQ